MKKSVGIVVALLMLIALTGCATPASSTITQAPQENDTGYLTEADWALYDTNYMFAVEIPNYDGDIFEAGKYVFEVVSAQSGYAGMFDIYIKSEENIPLSDLGESDYTIGGQGGMPITIDLKAGQYVYVVPYQDLVYEPTGYLAIKKQ